MRARKRVVLLALVSLLTAGNVFAHDKGDFMVHIEPQFIFSLPKIGESVKDNDEIYGYRSNAGGFGFVIRARPEYWFFDVFGVSAGFGYSIQFDDWKWHYVREDSYSDRTSISGSVWFTRGYITFPVGVNFSSRMFIAGFGATFNILMHEGASADGYDKDKYDSFYFKSYIGWYLDIGFDRSGRKGGRHGFGMALRFAGSFTDNLAGLPTGRNVSEKHPYRDFSISIVLSPAFQVASLPIVRE